MRLVVAFVRLLFRLGELVFAVLVAAWCALFAALRAVRAAALWTYDFIRARWAMRGGVLHCPKGHAVPLEGGTYCCQSCGFTYGGPEASILVCANPECAAPVTWYVNCPECGLSVRNPYRWGRP